MKRVGKNSLFLFVLANLFLPAFLYSQSNSIIDQLLQEEKAKYGEAVYMVLTAAGTLPEDAAPADAMRELNRTGLNRREAGTDDPISLGMYSYIIMQTFSIRGGMLYSLFPSPRYASRELGFKGYIRENSGAYRTLTGREALAVLGRVVRDHGGQGGRQ